MEPCSRKDDITDIKNDIKEIRKDVRSLLQFKWQITGGSVVGGFFGSIFVALVMGYLTKQI